MAHKQNIIKKTIKRRRSDTSFRLNILFFIVFLLFAVLIGQLAYLQIGYGSKFQADVDKQQNVDIKGNVPRGQIYDNKGRVLVENKAENAIIYTKGIGEGSTNNYETAKKLTKLIHIPNVELRKSDIADFYLANKKNFKKLYDKLPENQRTDSQGNERDNQEVYRILLDKVEKMNLTLSPQEEQEAYIYKQMASASQFSTIYIKNSDVSDSEIALVSEHLGELPGVNIGTDWKRNYPDDESLKGIIGSVSTEKSGLPKDRVDELLTMGYSRNDRVGVSQIEEGYEDLLKGTKIDKSIIVNSQNEITGTDTLYNGRKGDNLNLTINADYQKMVNNALQSSFKTVVGSGVGQYSDGAYAVAINPKTGAVLAMAGQYHDRINNKITNDPLGVLNRSFTMGSAVKPATIMGGMMDGVITPTNNTLPDVPIYLPATPIKKSVYPIGTFSALTAEQALEYSSNIYVMDVVMKEAHAKYVPNKYIKMDDDVFTKVRNYFSMFGLGTRTGIDIPGESPALIGSTTNENGELKVGSALDLAFGNYDGYTPIQMAQYVSTIANNGVRMQPYVVQSSQDTLANGDLGRINYYRMPTYVSKLNATDSELKVVQTGMNNVVHGHGAWTTGTRLADINPGVSAKTGIAQSFARADAKNSNSEQIPTFNVSVISYAPSTNPEIAIAVVYSNLTSYKTQPNIELAHQMLTDYYALNNKK